MTSIMCLIKGSSGETLTTCGICGDFVPINDLQWFKSTDKKKKTKRWACCPKCVDKFIVDMEVTENNEDRNHKSKC